MNITGKFISASPVFAVGQNGTQKRTFSVDITGNSQYTNLAEFSLMGQNITLVDHLTYGMEIEISFNINGRKWRDEAKQVDKIFMDLQCFGIVEIKRERVQAAQTSGILPPAAETVAPVPTPGKVEEQLPEWLQES